MTEWPGRSAGGGWSPAGTPTAPPRPGGPATYDAPSTTEARPEGSAPGAGAGSSGGGAGTVAPTTGIGGSLAGSATAPRVTTSPPSGAADPRRGGGRRARVQLRRIDPWSVLRFAFIASLALFVVFLVAVAVLYGVLAGMGVFSTINEQLQSVTSSGGNDPTGGFQVDFSFLRIMGWSVLLGIVNVILMTALATLAAFVYNLVAELVGGIEVVFAERE